MASAVPLIGLYVNGDNIFGSGQLEVGKDKVIYTGVLSTTGRIQLDLCCLGLLDGPNQQFQ